MRFVVMALLACVAGATQAQAKPTIAVLGLEPVNAKGAGKTDIDRAKALTARMRAAVEKEHGRLAPRGNRDLLEMRLLYECSFVESACLAKVGNTLGADMIVYGSIETLEQGNVRVSLFLFDVRAKRYKKSFNEKIAISSLNASLAAQLVARLFGKDIKGNIDLALEGVPSTAVVYLDGVAQGTAGQTKSLVADEGAHEVRIVAKDGRRVSKRIKVGAGQTVSISIALADADSSSAGGTSRILFWSSVAVLGASATALTVTGMQLRGAESDKNDALERLANDGIFLDAGDACSDAEGRMGRPEYGQIRDACSTGKSKATLSNVFIGTTVAAAVAAGFFLYTGYLSDDGPSDKPAVTIVPHVGPNSVGAGVAIEF